jgi:glycosyltransferase involved in cell wall biosynthesis
LRSPRSTARASFPNCSISLFGQTCQGFTILVSDDRSTDSTLDIIADYQRRYPGRITMLEPDQRLGGPLANFSRLIDHLKADYAFLCDHDDVWLPNKIALCLEEIRSLEARHGSSTPLLVHTDLTVVDSDLEIISPSSFLYQDIDPGAERASVAADGQYGVGLCRDGQSAAL